MTDKVADAEVTNRKIPLKRKHSSASGEDDLSPAKEACTAPPANRSLSLLRDEGSAASPEPRKAPRPIEKLRRTKVDRSHRQKCAHCRRKTGLASTYDCRCGQKFCPEHRYAETHDCCYDYKSQGRLELLKNNPIVRADKLTRI